MRFSVDKHKAVTVAKIIPATPTHGSELKGNYYHSRSHHYGQYSENCIDDLDTQ